METKVKIKIKRETTEEVEISLPHFFKLKFDSIGDTYYAAFETHGVEVQCRDFYKQISRSRYKDSVTQFIGDALYEPVTRDEFQNVYNSALQSLNAPIDRNVCAKPEVSIPTNELKAA